jgi:hypothetical protein
MNSNPVLQPPYDNGSEYTGDLFPMNSVLTLPPKFISTALPKSNGKYGEKLLALKPEASLERVAPALSNAALYGVLGDLIKKGDPYTIASPAAVLLQYLVMAGNSIGRVAKVRFKNRDNYPNLFTIVVGPTAKGAKGSALRLCEDTFKEISPEWYTDRIISGLGSGQAIIGALQDTPENTDRRLLIVEQEYASVMGVMSKSGANLNEMIRKAWDETDFTSATKHCKMKASSCHVSLIAHITREEFTSLMMRKKAQLDMKNGFVNRVLWCYSHRTKSPMEVQEMPEGFFTEDYERLKEALVSIQNESDVTLRLSEDAQKLMEREADSIEVSDYGITTDTDNRGMSQVLRISLIFSLLDNAREVKAEHLEAAIAVWNYCKKSARWVFEDHEFSSLANKLFVALEAQPRTWSEVYETVFRNNYKKVQIRKIIREISHLLVDPSVCD